MLHWSRCLLLWWNRTLFSHVMPCLVVSQSSPSGNILTCAQIPCRHARKENSSCDRYFTAAKGKAYTRSNFCQPSILNLFACTHGTKHVAWHYSSQDLQPKQFSSYLAAKAHSRYTETSLLIMRKKQTKEHILQAKKVASSSWYQK